jgi:hypothetical protein
MAATNERLEGVMNLRAACLSALLVVAGSSLAAAGPIADAAERAEALQAEGKTVEALDALDAAVAAVWEASPLVFRNVTVVTSSAGFGAYEERPDATFEPDEKLTVYVEPIGFGYKGEAGEATVDFSADLALQNATGQVLNESENVFTLSSPTRAGKREFAMTLSFAVPFLRPGEYKAVFTVHDQNSDKSGSFEVPFSVVLPGSGAAPAPAN